MKAKVVNELSDYYNKIIDVKSLNYKYIKGVLLGGCTRIKVPFEDVEFQYDYEWEKNIVKYRDILNISLPQSASIKFYGAICHVIEEYFNGEIKSIGILRDINEKARKNYWYKSMEIVINDSHPASITVSGREYADKYNINIEDVDVRSTVCECKDNILKLKELIRGSMEKIRLYEKAINSLEGNKNSRYKYKAIEGR